jgi:3-deoxy-7-phosphoheptulonate synthase
MNSCDSLSIDWSVNSWQSKELYQSVNYSSDAEFNSVCEQLASLPPLVPVTEILSLKQKNSQAILGDAIILQVGDCAESFDTDEEYTAKQAKFIAFLGSLFQAGQECQVVTIGRIAGQYAKPRSSEMEMQNGLTLPSYRGDIINNIKFDKYSRTPNPDRMLKAYNVSKRNLAIIRAQIQLPAIYSSHESLHLPYESALTRKMHDGYWYNLGAHFLWVGVRTSHLNSAHLEYIRGINNPIGVKISALDTPEKILSLVNFLNPDNKPGRIALIYRFGCDAIEKSLPKMLSILSKAKKQVVWIADPMHGNTKLSKLGYKIRDYDEILLELKHAKLIHGRLGIYLSGIHLEATWENVTECIGGPAILSERDINTNYKTLVDPRLNFSQAVSLIQEFNQY